MDAVEFLKERKRLCEVYFEKTECKECPLENMGCWTVDFCADDSCEKVIAIVEQWSKEHPRKTRQSVFLEQYPEAKLTEDGVLALCPIAISSECSGENGRCVSFNRKCGNCRREFWLSEVENAEAK